MAARDYTDVFAHFSDKVAAELLANYIVDSGFPCDLVEIFDPGFGRRYGIRVTRSLIEDLKESLKLTPIAKYRELVSPEVMAGRLAREKIPCYVGGIFSRDRKSTRLNSSHVEISYAVFCLKKKKAT